MHGEVDTANEPTRRTEPEPTHRLLLSLSGECAEPVHIDIPRVKPDTVSDDANSDVVVVEHGYILQMTSAGCNSFVQKSKKSPSFDEFVQRAAGQCCGCGGQAQTHRPTRAEGQKAPPNFSPSNTHCGWLCGIFFMGFVGLCYLRVLC